jgi:hypothetical protein
MFRRRIPDVRAARSDHVEERDAVRTLEGVRMHKHRAIKKRSSVMSWAVAATAVALGALAVASGSGFTPGSRAEAGTPRLVVDRDTVDLGRLPFETPAHVAFTLTNLGDAPLAITDVPRVDAVQGC